MAADTSDESVEIAINATNFPDEIFREYISEKFDDDGSGGLSAEEIGDAQTIEVNYMGISSLEGIEYFTKLEYLECERNNLSGLDVSNCTALTSLWCDGNNLSSLDVSNCTALTSLWC
ncbi:MAG: hypothetical protein LUG99_22625, partial [Lachnospiraceae bacterium]|nr:hypothetical protein [Lachnospiraceae bacterium]